MAASRADRSRDRRHGDDHDGDSDLKMLNLIRLAMREEDRELKEGFDGVAKATAELGGRVRAVETEVSKISSLEQEIKHMQSADYRGS